MGIIPADTTPSERPPWVQPWDSLDRGRQALFARMMEVYAGFLAHTDAQIGRLLDGLRGAGLLDNTLVLLASDNGASAEGGPHGSFNELRFTHDRLDDVDDTIARMDEIGEPHLLQPLRLGMGMGGQHPVQALEALHVAGRRPHPAGRALAGAHHRRWRGARPVLPRGRPAADRAGGDRGRPPRRRGRCARSGPSTGPASWTPSTMRPRRAPATASTSSCWAAAPSTPTVGRRRPTTSGPRSASSVSSSRAAAPSTTTAGRSSDSPTTSPRSTTSPKPSPTSSPS